MTEYEAEEIEIAAARATELRNALRCLASSRSSAYNAVEFLADISNDDLPAGVMARFNSALSELSVISKQLETLQAECNQAEVMKRCATIQAEEY